MAHYTFETDSIEYHVTEYNGNIETCYTPQDTTLRIFNTIGYYSNSTYYHYIKDHLGNICAVVNSTRDSVIQRTIFYASGVPRAQSWVAVFVYLGLIEMPSLDGMTGVGYWAWLPSGAFLIAFIASSIARYNLRER